MTNLWAFLLQTLYVTGVGLLLLAIKTLLKDKLSPRWQYAVWSVLALRILLPAYTGKYYVLLPLPLWVETAKVMVEPHWASAYTNVYEATQVTSPIPWLTGAPVSLSDWLFLLYVVGVVVTLLRYLISWLSLCLLLRQGTPVPADVQEQIERIGKTYGCKTCRAIELPGLPSPMVCGVFRPVLALPKGKALDDHVILHELLHLNYKDALQNVFWCFCRALHWCNPIVRLLLNRVGNDMESLCDQRVLERLRGEDRRNYGISLLAMANDKYPRAVGTTSLSNGGKNIAQRIEAIVRFKRYPRGMALASVCVVVVLAASCLVGMVDKEAGLQEGFDYVGYTNQQIAAAHLNYCTTVAGALDTYAKGIMDDNLLFLSMASPDKERAALEAMAAQGEHYSLFGETLTVYPQGNFGQAEKEPVTIRTDGQIIYDHQAAYFAVQNLQKQADGSYTALLMMYASSVPDTEQYMDFNVEYMDTCAGQVALPVLVRQERGRYVVEQTGEPVIYLERTEGMYYRNLVPAERTYTAEGTYGTVTVELRNYCAVDNLEEPDDFWRTPTDIRKTAKPNIQFETMTYEYFAQGTFPENVTWKAVGLSIDPNPGTDAEYYQEFLQSVKTCQSSGGSSTSGLSWSTSPIEDDWNGTIVDYNSAPWLDAPPKTITLHFVVNDQGTVTEETLTAKEVPTNGA
mgnify:FL=1